jgi:ComF family protein
LTGKSDVTPAGRKGQAVADGSIRGATGRCQPTVWPKVYSVLDRAGRGLLPARCILCAHAGRGPAHDLCADCEADLPWLSVACSRCGLPVDDPTLQGTTTGCAGCRGRSLPYRGCHAGFRYEFPLSELVHGLKYHGALANARVLGTLLAGSLVRQRVRRDVDLLVPLPLHTSRLVARGFNQSLEIARFTAAALGMAIDGRALHRRRETAPQVGLAREARADNVRGAFAAVEPIVAGRAVALLDDVVTTGATVAEASRALLIAGARSVDVWCVARASD